jgi:hypothetical protein
MVDKPQAKQQHLKVLLVKQRSTTNTVKFEEVTHPDRILVMGTLYVQKKALAMIGNPDLIEVTVRQTGVGGG